MEEILNQHKRYDIIRLDSTADAKRWGKDGDRFNPWPFTHITSGKGSYADLANGSSGYNDYIYGDTYEKYGKKEFTIYIAAADGWESMELPDGLGYHKGKTYSSSWYTHDGIGVVNEYSTSLMAFRVDSAGRLRNAWLRTTPYPEGYTPAGRSGVSITKRMISRILGMNFNEACPPCPDPEILPEAVLGAVRDELAKARAAGKRAGEWFGNALGSAGKNKWRPLNLSWIKGSSRRAISGDDYPIGMKFHGACFVSDSCELMPILFMEIMKPFFTLGGKMLAAVKTAPGSCELIGEDGERAIGSFYDMGLDMSESSDLNGLGWIEVRRACAGDLNYRAFADADGFLVGDWVRSIHYNPYAGATAPQLTPDGNIICQKMVKGCDRYNILSKDGSYLLDEWMEDIHWLSGDMMYRAKLDDWLHRWCACRTGQDEAGVYDARERRWLLGPSANIGKIAAPGAEPASGYDHSTNFTFTDKSGVWHCLDADGVVYEYYGGKIESGWS